MRGLKKTLESIPAVLSGVEHIVIDGYSSDGTIEYLKTESQRRDHLKFVSEADQGIYDAMNKGLKIAHGEYVIFMNAGDGFYYNTTIDDLVSVLNDHKDIDILYGETMLVDDTGKDIGVRSAITTRKIPDQLSLKSFKAGMVVCHQSFVVRKALAGYYRLNNLSADYDWMIHCVKKSTKIIQYPGIIAAYLVGGTSEQYHFRSLVDRYKVMCVHYGVINTFLIHLAIIWRSITFKIHRKVHP